MSDALLVPIAVEGLLVNTEVASKQKFLRWHVSYDAIDTLTDPLPDPFQNIDPKPPEAGIHLRWSLPRALTRGQSNSARQQQVKFECIPNRWLIVRFGAGATKAWVVESDYLGNDGSNSFALPNSNGFSVTRIGRCYELPAAPPHLAAAANAKGFLTAVGAGDVAFTAYQPDVKNVLSFHDPVKDVQPETMLTYLVTGWFANPGDDPLDGVTTIAELQKRLDERRWSAELPAGTIPSRTIVHGTLQEVKWQLTTKPERVDPDVSKMTVAVGNTAIDALAALIANFAAQRSGVDPARLEQRLQAFQYDLFDVLDEHGTAALEVNIRRGWFSTTPGGTMWSLTPIVSENPSATPPAVNDAQKQWLASLNRNQQDLDDARRLLRSMQAELYELWWKKARIDVMDATDRRNQTKPPRKINIVDLGKLIGDAIAPGNDDGLMKRVTVQKSKVATLAASLPDPANRESIGDWNKKMPAPLGLFELKPATEQPFNAPVDPVVVVAGVTPPPGVLDPNQKLPCRVGSQCVASVTSGGMTFSPSTGSVASVMPAIDLSKLPAHVGASVTPLLREMFFIDPTNASAIASKGAGWTDAPRIAALAQAQRDQRSARKPAFAFAKWAQAWSPLYLIWQIRWYAPAGLATGPQMRSDVTWRENGMDTRAYDPTQWTFDGRDGVRARGAEYYVWNGAGPIDQLPYTGRSLLTPQATLLFIDRLNKYAEQHPGDADVQKIRELIAAIGANRFLSQAMTVNRPLAARRHLQTRAPAEIAEAIGNEYETVPNTTLGDARPCYTPQCDEKSFFWPYRGGFFAFEKLQLIDAFGQMLDLIEANGNTQGTDASFKPVRGHGLVPDRTASLDRPFRFIKQAPRVVQPSRLRMRLIDAVDDSRDLGLWESANPICAWIVHNFLDRSLAFYSPAGLPIGDLIQSGTVAKPDVTWIPTPLVRDSSGAVVTPPALNKHAQAFVDQLRARSDRGTAFKALMKIIDERVGTIDPGGDPGDPDLAVLIGRPLALVRARVELQLSGLPLANGSWRSTPVGTTSSGRGTWDISARQTGGFESIDVPVRIGTEELTDDGVIGYFDADSSAFNSVRAPQSPTSYIKTIGAGNYVVLNFSNKAQRNLTLLADPRTPLHANTGILPTASLSVPPELLEPALRRMAFTFRIGPILSTRDSIRIPRPAEQNGDWLWLRRTSTADNEPADARSIIASSENPQLGETPRAIDGWLKFTPTRK